MRIKAWRSPAQRCLRLFAATAVLALFSSTALAQTAEQIAAQKLLMEQMQQQLLQAQTSPPPPTSTTTTTAPVPTSTDMTTKPTTTTVNDPKLLDATSPSPTPTTIGAVAPAPAPSWTGLSGAARDIGAGGSGLWVVGTNATTNGYGLYRWVNGTWASVASTGATRIDVDASGQGWMVDSRGFVFQFKTSFVLVGNGASDIGVGANGAVWKIGNVAEGSNFGIYRSNDATGTTWTKVSGNAVRIDVDPQGNAWVVNAGGAVYRWTGSTWVNVPGVSARDVGIGGDGSVFVTGADNATYRWSGTAWVQRSGSGNSISVDATGIPVVVNAAGSIYKGWK